MSDLTSFNCPSCGASLQYDGRSETIRCAYCDSTIIVPDSLKSNRVRQGVLGDEVPETGESLHNILILVQNGRKIEAIKLYRETFGVGLKEAKEAVEQLEHGEPTAIQISTVGAGSAAASSGCGCIWAIAILAIILGVFGAVFWVTSPEQAESILESVVSGDFDTAAESLESASSSVLLNRQVFNDVVATTRGGDGLGPDLLLENWQYGAEAIPIFVSYAEASGENGRREIRWEQEVATTDNLQSFNFGFDNQNIYITMGNVLKTYGRSDGELVWQLNLSDQVTRLCAHCIRVHDGVVVVLTDDNTIFAVDAKTGQQLWTVQLEDEIYPYVEKGQFTFGFVAGQVAILDRVEIEETPSRVLSLYDLQTGELTHQLNPGCPDPGNFFPDDTLLLGGQVFINEATDALYFVFGATTSDSLCVQQWDATTGEMVWGNRLADGTELPFGLNSGITTLDSRSHNFVMDEASLLLAVDTAVSDGGIVQIDLSNGETLLQVDDDGYELHPLGLQDGVLVASAVRTRGSDQVAVWGIDAVSSTSLWQLPLQAENLFEESPFDDRWSYYLVGDGVILIQLLTDTEPNQLLAQKVAHGDGSLIYEVNSDLTANSWRGLTWTPNYAYLSAQALHELDLSDGSLTAVWP